MGVAVTGMHYTGMAALHVHGGTMPSASIAAVSGMTAVSGATAATFLIPVLLVISPGHVPARRWPQHVAVGGRGPRRRRAPASGRVPGRQCAGDNSQSLRRNTQYRSTPEPIMITVATRKPTCSLKPGYGTFMP